MALLFIDGLAASESCLMEAVYATGRFPVLFVGGSAGGTLDYRHTWLFDGDRVLENHAVIAFVRIAPGKRYGVFKSQNFQKRSGAGRAAAAGVGPAERRRDGRCRRSAQRARRLADRNGRRLVRADETAMAQVLINLIHNAADALDRSGGEVGLETVRLEEAADGAWPHPAGRYAALGVRDTGCGMDAATVARMFDPFFTTKSVGQGTGLGLPVVHGIVAGWGGHITVDSAVGQGTTIRILLPALPAEPAGCIPDLPKKSM